MEDQLVVGQQCKLLVRDVLGGCGGRSCSLTVVVLMKVSKMLTTNGAVSLGPNSFATCG